MNEPPAQPSNAGSTTQEPSASFLQNLVDVYFAPADAFARIVRRPAWIVPAVAYLLVAIAFFAIWSSRMEPREFAKAQLEQSPFAQKMTSEQREQALDQQVRMMPIFGWVGSIVGSIVGILITAGVLHFVFRFFYAAELRFAQSLANSSWVLFAVSLVSSPLVLTVMGLKDDWNLDPREALQANLTLLLDRTATAKPLWALVSGLDLFSIWMVFLLAVGFGVAARRKTGSALWGVAGPWLLLVLAKVALASIF
jgi:hypothetical protein